MNYIDHYIDLPNGFYLQEFHHSANSSTPNAVSYHLAYNRPEDTAHWDEMRLPCYSSLSAGGDSHAEFWTWAKENLPVYIIKK